MCMHGCGLTCQEHHWHYQQIRNRISDTYFPHLHNGWDNTSQKGLLEKMNKMVAKSNLVCYLTYNWQLIKR